MFGGSQYIKQLTCLICNVSTASSMSFGFPGYHQQWYILKIMHEVRFLLTREINQQNERLQMV